MENENHIEITDVPTLTISDNAINFLLVATRWAKFIAIVGFVFVGILAFGGLISGIVFSYMDNQFARLPFPPFIFSFLYLIMGVLYFFPVFYLFKFSTHSQYAIKTLNPIQLENAFRNIKSYFKYIGILTIVTLSLFIIAIIGIIKSFGLFFIPIH